jgi:hypothetical protein
MRRCVRGPARDPRFRVVLPDKAHHSSLHRGLPGSRSTYPYARRIYGITGCILQTALRGWARPAPVPAPNSASKQLRPLPKLAGQEASPHPPPLGALYFKFLADSSSPIDNIHIYSYTYLHTNIRATKCSRAVDLEHFVLIGRRPVRWPLFGSTTMHFSGVTSTRDGDNLPVRWRDLDI